MCYYKFYGLTLQTNRSLPGFSPLSYLAEVDVKIKLLTEKLPWVEELDWMLLPESIPRYGFLFYKAQGNEQTYYRVKQLVKQDSIEYIFNDRGDRIWGFYSREDVFRDAVSLLLGYVLGTVMRLRGFLAFHASAIAIKHRAILLAGYSGAGKSTTAAAFSQAGYSILADDIAVLKRECDKFWVQPGYPCLRLWPKSVKALNGASVEELSRVSSRGNKRYFNLTAEGTFHSSPLPLASIYILGKRDSQLSTSEVVPLAPPQAMISLIESVYSSYFLNNSLRRDEFKQLAKFVGEVPVRKLQRPNNLEHLPQLCDLIVEDFSNLGPIRNDE